jgi:hypothetical protein
LTIEIDLESLRLIFEGDSFFSSFSKRSPNEIIFLSFRFFVDERDWFGRNDSCQKSRPARFSA